MLGFQSRASSPMQVRRPNDGLNTSCERTFACAIFRNRRFPHVHRGAPIAFPPQPHQVQRHKTHAVSDPVAHSRVQPRSGRAACRSFQSPNQHLRAQCGPNPIVCENLNPGTPDSEWDISGAGDSDDSGLCDQHQRQQGRDRSLQGGYPRIDVQHRHLSSRLLRRPGRAQNRRRSPVSHGIQQPNCLTNGSTGLIDCGNWTETAAWSVPSTAVSGVYIAKLTRVDTGGASHIVFVVRDDQAQADILFQTSDTTWQAYNTCGGNSLYVGGPGTNPGRAYKVSYNRPFTTRGTSAGGLALQRRVPDDPMPRSQRLQRQLLDRRRYGSHRRDRAQRSTRSFSRSATTSTGPGRSAPTSRRRAPPASTSPSSAATKCSGRRAGKPASTAPTRRTGRSSCYKETHANAKIDPLDPPTWTGTWRDPRFSPPADGGRPENALTGTIFTVNAAPATTAIRVTGAFASQPFWRNTRVAALAPSGSTTLTPGTLGYEWDENLNNGSRPAGLIDAVVDDGQRRPEAAGQRVNLRKRHGDSQPDLVSAQQRRVGVRRRHGAVVVGPRQQPRPRQRAGRSRHAAGDRESVLRHGRRRLDRCSRVLSRAHRTRRRPPRRSLRRCQGASLPSGTPVTITGTASDIGGAVTKVEVSTNGGTTWSNATGTTSWTFAWTPGGTGFDSHPKPGNRHFRKRRNAVRRHHGHGDRARSRHDAADGGNHVTGRRRNRCRNGGDRFGHRVRQYRRRRRDVPGRWQWPSALRTRPARIRSRGTPSGSPMAVTR